MIRHHDDEEPLSPRPVSESIAIALFMARLRLMALGWDVRDCLRRALPWWGAGG